MVDIASDVLMEALGDYFLLLNRGYPERPTVKLVGDRYRLTREERMTLYRGITSKDKALARQARITTDLKGRELYIDGYNVLFTLVNYLMGKLIFIGNDGILRDCGEVYGKVENEKLFYRGVNFLLEFITRSGTGRVEIYLDRTRAGSDLYSRELGKRLVEAGIAGEVFLVKSADRELIKKKDGIIASSDSEIIDATDCQIADLARQALETKFGIKILDLGNFL